MKTLDETERGKGSIFHKIQNHKQSRERPNPMRHQIVDKYIKSVLDLGTK